jgi:hypothetical protein
MKIQEEGWKKNEVKSETMRYKRWKNERTEERRRYKTMKKKWV